MDNDRRRISDDELRELIKKAIEDGETKTSFHYDLTAKNISMDAKRLNKFWTEMGGPIQMKRGGWI